MTNFYYTASHYVIKRHQRTGKILREGWWTDPDDKYATLEEAKKDNPPGSNRVRFVKRYYEVVEEQEIQNTQE